MPKTDATVTGTEFAQVLWNSEGKGSFFFFFTNDAGKTGFSKAKGKGRGPVTQTVQKN